MALVEPKDAFLTLQEFLILHPEFCRNSDRDHVEATLSVARVRVAGEWGDMRNIAHGYITAHMLATSPMGQQARLDPKKDPLKTTYRANFEELKRETFMGFSVT